MTIIIPSECRFIAAADRMSLVPKGEGWEIAFWGRSNVGKSSLLNALMGRVGLARVSKTPGRTQSIHFYQVSEDLRFVDLPGYGYANVPLSLQKKWDQLLSSYFTRRQNLLWIYLLVDSRRGLGPLDEEALSFLRAHRRRVRCILTKTDALSSIELDAALQNLHNTDFFQEGVVLTSARKKQGIPLLLHDIETNIP
jgi:GTP-binding protein